FLKPRADAFSSDRLDTFLRSRQVNHLFLMGIGGATSIARTARGALDRGYRVTVISDGICTTSEKKWANMLEEFAADQAFSITSGDFHELFRPRVSPSGNGNLVVPRLRRKRASVNRDCPVSVCSPVLAELGDLIERSVDPKAAAQRNHKTRICL